MDENTEDNLAKWVASVTQSMNAVSKFGEASLSTFDEMVVVLKEHELRLKLIEDNFQSLIESVTKFFTKLGMEVNE